MTRLSKTARTLAAACLGALVAGGCANNAQTLSPQDKARFGYAGMPKPPEAQRFMQQQAKTAAPAAAAQTRK